MRRPLSAFLLAAVAAVLFALPASAARPRLVRVSLSPAVTLQRVLESGLDVVESRGVSVDLLLWPGEEPVLEALGAAVTVVDDDPGLHAAQRARAELAARPRLAPRRVLSAARADGVFRMESLPPLGSGSLGGHWTLAEVKTKLDDLVASDTQDLVADKLDTLGWSLQGRPIWGLQLGAPVAGPDTRPVVYFNAVTHAREPNGMESLLYFVDDLLANYGVDPVATSLLQTRRIVICPIVNPDGYAWNQRIYDSTGAFGNWRKNLHDNDNSHTTNTGDGVDLNRNYGFKWGYDNVGSSATATSDTYRGASAWSEPETRVQRDAFSALAPACGFSFHTYSGLFVHPWGYANVALPDSAKYKEWNDQLTMANGFLGGQAPRILYAANGEFSDWTYGDTLLKPRAFTWTPEVGFGSDGFWPTPARVVPIAKSVLRSCYEVTGFAGAWLKVERASVIEGWLAAGQTAHLAVRVRNIGLRPTDPAGVQVTLTPLDPELGAQLEPVAFPAIGSFQGADADLGATFLVAAADTTTPGRMLRLRADFTDAAGLACRDTIEIVVGVPTPVVVDACQSTTGWTISSAWGVKSNDAGHPDAYFTDATAGTYANNANTTLRYTNSIDLSHGVHAWAFFEDRWLYEQEYDGGLFEASLNGTTWTPLPSRASIASPSTNAAGSGRPIFPGSHYTWWQDRVDLSAFAGGSAASAVRFRFRTVADAGTNFAGLNVDSLRIYVYDPAAQPAPVRVAPDAGPARLALAPPAPNPARGTVTFAFTVPAGAAGFALDVLDVQGRRVFGASRTIERALDGTAAATANFRWGWDLRDDTGRRVAPGLYLVRVRTGGRAAVQRLVVMD